ncbi:MAG: alpha-hydroxy-acid oxidizing protein [Emergencia timonensis]
MEGFCKVCPECNGKGCKNQIPGPGAKGTGDTAIRNYDKWKEIRVNMDTLTERHDVSIQLELFGKKFAAPIFAGPVGAVNMHYGDKYNDLEYNHILVPACKEKGIAAFTGDGMDPEVMKAAGLSIKAADGCGVPTIKPWNKAMIDEKMAIVKEADAFAVAMDIDAAGLPFLKNFQPPAGSKSVEELKEIIADAGVPFIVRHHDAKSGAESKSGRCGRNCRFNHGGRVLDQCLAVQRF